MRLGPTPAESRRAWETAPALAATAPLGPPRPGASLLAATTSPGGMPRALVAVQRLQLGRRPGGDRLAGDVVLAEQAGAQTFPMEDPAPGAPPPE